MSDPEIEFGDSEVEYDEEDGEGFTVTFTMTVTENGE